MEPLTFYWAFSKTLTLGSLSRLREKWLEARNGNDDEETDRRVWGVKELQVMLLFQGLGKEVTGPINGRGLKGRPLSQSLRYTCIRHSTLTSTLISLSLS